MRTQILRKKIDKKTYELLPLFEVTDEELKKFQRPAIVRELGENDYPDLSSYLREVIESSGVYDGIRNLFYFNNSFNPSQKKSGKMNFIHLVSSYIHRQINPKVRKYDLSIDLGEKIEGYFEMKEILSNYILIERDYLNLKEDGDLCKDAFHLYLDKGSDFLPKLARMSLEEILDKKLIYSLR